MISDDKRYKEMVLREGVYVPDAGVDYPTDDPYQRLLSSVHLRELKFDASYTYLDDSFKFKLNRFLGYTMVYTYAMIYQRLKYGIRFKGREILRKYKNQFKNGAISICNHCYRWDGVSVVQALRYRYLWIPMYADHFNGKDLWYLKHVGGIPIPSDMGGLRKFSQAFDEIHRRGGWIHIFPEECNWLFYKPIKPFRKGAFVMAYKYNVPVVPMNISYRERTGIYKLFGKKEEPLLTVSIGEPIFPDTSAPRTQEVDRMLNAAHSSVCSLAGIEHNPWPAFWDENKSGNI